jgi:hypothetical protein
MDEKMYTIEQLRKVCGDWIISIEVDAKGYKIKRFNWYGTEEINNETK